MTLTDVMFILNDDAVRHDAATSDTHLYSVHRQYCCYHWQPSTAAAAAESIGSNAWFPS